jgi:hypothetical protein
LGDASVLDLVDAGATGTGVNLLQEVIDMGERVVVEDVL